MLYRTHTSNGQMDTTIIRHFRHDLEYFYDLLCIGSLLFPKIATAFCFANHSQTHLGFTDFRVRFGRCVTVAIAAMYLVSGMLPSPYARSQSNLANVLLATIHIFI